MGLTETKLEIYQVTALLPDPTWKDGEPARSISCRQRFTDWINTRGGIVVWGNQDLSFDRGNMYGPVNGPDGQPSPKPHWAYSAGETITDISRFKFAVGFKELERVKIALNRKMRGFKIVLTDGSTKRLKSRLSHWRSQHADAHITYTFDPQGPFVMEGEQVYAVIEETVFE